MAEGHVPEVFEPYKWDYEDGIKYTGDDFGDFL